MNKILAVVAHPDDEVIGPGGTLLKHVRKGDRVAVLILGDGKSSRFPKYKKTNTRAEALSRRETKSALQLLKVERFWKESLPDNRFDRLEPTWRSSGSDKNSFHRNCCHVSLGRWIGIRVGRP